MNQFRIGSLEYSPYNNRNQEHLSFLNDLLDEMDRGGELENRMGDISYMFDHAYQELDSFSLTNRNAYLVYDQNQIVGFVYMYLNQENELLLYLGIHEKFRKLGYSSKINQELTDYLLKNFPIQRIKVQVEDTNIGNKKAILKAGFTPLEEDFYIKER